VATDLRTEQDLQAALDLLCSDAPAPAAVLLPIQAAAQRPVRRPWAGWLRPVAAALVVLAVAAGITFATSSQPAADKPMSGPNAVVGVWWQLQRVNGQHHGTGGASLDIGVRGNFQQGLGLCEWVSGRITVTPSVLQLAHVRHVSASCIAVRGETSRRFVTDLRRLLRGNVNWSVSANTLTLHAAGVTATYRPHPGSGTPSRQWTYRGVGISVPASWPRNAMRCDAPTTSTVIYPHPASACTAAGDMHATTVQFSPLDGKPAKVVPADRRSPTEIDNTAATEGFRQLPDGRQVAEVRVPTHNVAVTITSPDPSLAAHLAEVEVYIVN
jgi:hypothetical protein